MKFTRSILIIAGLLMMAMPALALDTYQFTIDSSSPHTINTGLIIEEGDQILIQAEGSMRVFTSRPFTAGWFDPSGLGRLNRGGMIMSNSSYGMLIGSFYGALTDGFAVGDLAAFYSQSGFEGNELLLGVNMSASDLAAAEGQFTVHVTRYTVDEAQRVTLMIDSDSPQVTGTGITSNPGDKFLIIGQGAAQVPPIPTMVDGWFDASGLGVLRRNGQIHPNSPYGALMGTFTSNINSGFYIGDVASWDTQTADHGYEFKVGLNMSASDLAAMQGSIVVHVLRIGVDTVVSVHNEDVPNSKAIVSVDNFPNPFNPLTTVRFELSRAQDVRLSIVNVAGEVVQTLASKTYAAGRHQLTWNGRDASGQGQASGTYFLRLETKDSVRTHKLTLIK